ncbi:MAG: lyase family protein, partial [Kiritimatiellia bacterium]|nr:lyase family protein [Kiritimatiellia bacterium]
MKTRTETDLLGSREIPEDSLWGIHTLRALENFHFSECRTPLILIQAMIQVKKAACLMNLELKALPPVEGQAILEACDALLREIPPGAFPIDAIQGGAGTSTNMNVNEVIANLALERLGESRGRYQRIHPIEWVNLHQSTNDVYPTAVRVAALNAIRETSGALAGLQGVFQGLEKKFAKIPKLGRTEWQPAVAMTLGEEFSAFAEAFARDRWRMAKGEERLRVVNLGGTAIGTGVTAPRAYRFGVVDRLRELTGLGLARAENSVDATANADPFTEVAGLIDACSVNLIKVSRDLRMLHLLGEIRLPPVQAGSTIMPGKVNPVILEAVISAGLRIQAETHLATRAASMGTLQLNEFMPMIAGSMLTAIEICGRA